MSFLFVTSSKSTVKKLDETVDSDSKGNYVEGGSFRNNIVGNNPEFVTFTIPEYLIVFEV